MSDSTTAATDLASQYTAQVAGDLERNVKEQERIAAEIAALQQQLTALQRDHTVLVNMQQALSVASGPGEPVAPPETGGANVPAPRGKNGVTSRADGPKRGKKTPAASSRAASRKPARRAPAGSTADGPKLVELVRRHLTEQREPRSAAEIAASLGEAHPGRTVKTTVVRSTLEGLVARNQAQRTKQGTSVFYTAPDGTGNGPEDGGDARP